MWVEGHGDYHIECFYEEFDPIDPQSLKEEN